jgi:hypothetical protein
MQIHFELPVSDNVHTYTNYVHQENKHFKSNKTYLRKTSLKLFNNSGNNAAWF